MYPNRQTFEEINQTAIKQIKKIGYFEGEVTAKHKSGRIFPVYASATLLVDEGNKPDGIVAVFRDLSDTKAMELKLEQQQLAMIRSDRLRSLGEMAAGIAHELNQPLSGVRGLAEHLLIGMDRGWNMTDEDNRKRLSLIIEQADRMIHIIEHVRMFARGSGKRDVQTTDPNRAVESVVGMLGDQLRQHGVELVIELADGLPEIDVNSFSLEEILINLLNNARDAVKESFKRKPDPAPRIVIRTKQEIEDENVIVRIDVRDNGTGIDPDNLPRIFEPFFTTKEIDRGSGLGLSISRSIVEDLGGSLTLESMQGKGTTATISIPVKLQQ